VTIPDLSKIKGFQWDKGNIDKSYEKHGVTPKETEESFLDTGLQVERDIKHNEEEKRYIAIGATFKQKLLFIVFTIRRKRIRIISARSANKKEKDKYEKAQKNSKI